MERRPNFIVIHTDQQRYDCVGAARRREGIYTPYIDSIAWQGANFRAAYCDCPICIPQRMSLLTGQTPAHHGLFSNTGIPYFPLETSLPAEMRRGGYQTAMVGRTMHTYPEQHSYGFEYYVPGDPSEGQDDKTDAFFRYIRDNTPAEAGGYYGGGSQNNSRAAYPFHLPDEFHHTKWTTNRALEFLDTRDKSRPYMLFVGYYAPHSPHNAPQVYYDQYYAREDLDEPYIAQWDIPPVSSGHVMARNHTLSREERRRLYAGYYGNIAFIDAQVGRILQKVGFENTYVIFTSDHGEMLGDHYLMQKNRPYEGAVHIPFLVMGPGIPDSQNIDAPVSWTDIMPTILDLAGLPIPESVDGHSLAPLLKGESRQWPRPWLHGECCHDFMFGLKSVPESEKHNYFYENGSQYITDGRLKYIWYVTSGKEQLFDVVNDYREQHDLSADPAYEKDLVFFRNALIRELRGRPEGFTDGERLIPGQTPRKTSEAVAALVEQRKKEGFSIAYSRGQTPMDRLDYRVDLMR